MTEKVLDHLSLQVLDLSAALRFYDAVVQPLGYRRVLAFDDLVGYGDQFPSFWVGVAADRVPNRPVHVAFTAPDRAAVDAFHAAAVDLGADSLHEPRVWPSITRATTARSSVIPTATTSRPCTTPGPESLADVPQPASLSSAEDSTGARSPRGRISTPDNPSQPAIAASSPPSSTAVS